MSRAIEYDGAFAAGLAGAVGVDDAGLFFLSAAFLSAYAPRAPAAAPAKPAANPFANPDI
jgi:hypothetical protein